MSKLLDYMNSPGKECERGSEITADNLNSLLECVKENTHVVVRENGTRVHIDNDTNNVVLYESPPRNREPI